MFSPSDVVQHFSGKRWGQKEAKPTENNWIGDIKEPPTSNGGSGTSQGLSPLMELEQIRLGTSVMLLGSLFINCSKRFCNWMELKRAVEPDEEEIKEAEEE